MTPQRPAPQAAPLFAPLDEPQEPDRVLIYGQAGVGKSTLAASSPKAIMVPVEKPGNHIKALVRAHGGRWTAQPETWAQLIELVRQAGAAPGFETLIIDGLTQAEGLCWAAVCQENKAKTIEDVGGGYGKGYSAALDRWRSLLNELDRVGRTRRIILVGHGDRRTVKNPEGKDYDEWALVLQNNASGLLRGWADAVLFACWESFSAGKEKERVGKLVATGNRIIRCDANGPWQAKNRHSLPAEMPLDWMALASAMWPTAESVRQRIGAALAGASEEVQGKVRAAMDAAGDIATLASIEKRLALTLAKEQGK